MATKCKPCMGKTLKELLATLEDPDLDKILAKIADCPTPTGIVVCGVGKNKRARSEYQQHMSECLKEQPIQGMPFGEATKYMKQCAARWKAQKKDH